MVEAAHTLQRSTPLIVWRRKSASRQTMHPSADDAGRQGLNLEIQLNPSTQYYTLLQCRCSRGRERAINGWRAIFWFDDDEFRALPHVVGTYVATYVLCALRELDLNQTIIIETFKLSGEGNG